MRGDRREPWDRLRDRAGLARRGARVALVCRDPARGEAARERIAAETPRAPAPELVLADLANLAEQAQVRAAAGELLERLPALHVLVNNAGAINARRAETVDGIEVTLALNHLAPCLVTGLLLDRLASSAPARVVTVSSDAHRSGFVDFDDLGGRDHHRMGGAYAQSKQANVLLTAELARRTAHRGITASRLHPEFARSRFARSDGPLGVIAAALTGGPS